MTDYEKIQTDGPTLLHIAVDASVRAVRCFVSRGARGAVFRDARSARDARGVCGAVFRDTGVCVLVTLVSPAETPGAIKKPCSSWGCTLTPCTYQIRLDDQGCLHSCYYCSNPL